MILLTGLYHERDAARRGELLECLRRNCALDSIEEVHLLYEENAAPEQTRSMYAELRHPKVRLVPHGRRATFAEYFAYANTHCRNRATVLANADIYFDASLRRLEDIDLRAKMLCLSRWDIQPDGTGRFFEQPASQDAWIFVPTIRIADCGFYLGTPGCDGRVAWQARHCGLEVSNPARTIRANHLHQTAIRHYTERQRLQGNYLSIVATCLETPWVWFVVSARNRLADLKESLPTLAGQPRSSTVLLDYGCEQGSGGWVTASYPSIRAAYGGMHAEYHGADARNTAAALADDDGILCFLDADLHAADRLSAELLPRYTPGSFMVPDRHGPGLANVVAIAKRDFEAIGGFDVAYRGVGLEVSDLRSRLAAAGFEERTFPAALLEHRPQTHRHPASEPDIAWRAVRASIHRSYQRAKSAVAAEARTQSIAQSSLNAIYRSIAAHHWSEYVAARTPGATAIGFRENMGYQVARLEPGASSHRNLRRPFTEVNDRLRGRQFTQVVASKVSPVQLRFLTPGKLYVLVGTDWDGQWPARQWLREYGRRESLSPARTSEGTAFEIWSLGGDIGDEYTIPTQVMLVADELRRI